MNEFDENRDGRIEMQEVRGARVGGGGGAQGAKSRRGTWEHYVRTRSGRRR